MADKKTYKVVDGPVGIRTEPNGQLMSAKLGQGDEIVTVDDTVQKDGYIWIKHPKGWSATSNIEGDEVFMLDISSRPSDTPRIYRVWAQNISLRETPNGKRLPGKLFRQMEVRVEPGSRTEAGGYIWWKHDKGWSAERSIDGREVFMKEVFDTPSLISLIPSKRIELPANWKGKMVLQVAGSTKVRDKPSTNPRGMILITMKPGKVVEVDMNTLVEADGYYWIRHDLGWSAIQSIDGKSIFLAEPGTIPGMAYVGPGGPKAEDLPGYRTLIKKLPISLGDIQWFQYFGNNMWAYLHGKQYGYDRYSQGLHGGLDYGNSLRAGIKVLAGIEGQYVRTEYPSPNNTRIYVKNGNYQFIYQHISNARQFSPGQQIAPDTVLAEIEHHSINNGWDHLHFEVRFMDEWIINPLLLLAQGEYDQLMGRFDAAKPNKDYAKTESTLNFFYKSAKWMKWATPLDQPMIRLKGQGLGPRFEETGDQDTM